MLARPSELVRSVIGCAIEVHRTLGPGLLESAYEACLASELTDHSLNYRRQVLVPIVYKGRVVDCRYRADFIVEDQLLIELKSIDLVLPIHTAQVLTYLKLVELQQALIINFNVTRLVDGLRNVLRTPSRA